MKSNNIIQVTVVSAATIITFTGATLIIPRTAKAREYDLTLPVVQQSIETTDSVEVNPIAIDYDLFNKYSSQSIREHSKKFERWNHNPEVLEYLGITRAEALEARINGKSFKDIAIEKGLDVNEVANIFEDNLIEKLNFRMKEGKLNPQRYEKIVSNLDELRQKFIEGSF